MKKNFTKKRSQKSDRGKDRPKEMSPSSSSEDESEVETTQQERKPALKPKKKGSSRAVSAKKVQDAGAEQEETKEVNRTLRKRYYMEEIRFSSDDSSEEAQRHRALQVQGLSSTTGTGA